ncbi:MULTISPECIES: DUF6783 domain-containing protein [Hungatella]|uniref:DUF6783 domain-containing protein n=1 Tax=Hungatella sp. TaxID=2613924 RepID=UPI0009BCEF82
MFYKIQTVIQTKRNGTCLPFLFVYKLCFSIRFCARACLKIHSRHLHAPLRGILGPNSVSVAQYASFAFR